MATVTVRDLDDDLKARLRIRAARNGRSMEAEIRAILRDALLSEADAQAGLGRRIHDRFADLGEVEIVIPPRLEMPRTAHIEP